MELEVATLKQELTQVTCREVAGMKFFDGMLEQTSVVVVQCGVGKVNAAMCVQILHDLFEITHVINTGVAGGLNDKLDIGDILISNAALQHDMNVEPLGYASGQVPGLDTLSFPADDKMKQRAIASCERVNQDIQVMEGLVVSGDQFIAEQAVRKHLIDTFPMGTVPRWRAQRSLRQRILITCRLLLSAPFRIRQIILHKWIIQPLKNRQHIIVQSLWQNL